MKFVTIRSGGDLRPAVLGAAGILVLSAWRSLRELISEGEAALAKASALAERASAGDWTPLSEVQLATPLPGATKNIFCVGRNYKQHIIEMSEARGTPAVFPKVPEFFSKPPTTIVGPEDGVERHAAHTEMLDYEVELALVIGKRGRNIAPENAFDHIFGYTIVNDISARDAQIAHVQFFKGKSFDTFCPIGPCIVSQDEFGEPGNHRISLKVNGEVRQDSNTSDMLFKVPEIIASLSNGLTLEPGDIIATGTPAGVAGGMNPPGWLDVGDVTEAEIEGIGVLRNHIVS